MLKRSEWEGSGAARPTCGPQPKGGEAPPGLQSRFPKITPGRPSTPVPRRSLSLGLQRRMATFSWLPERTAPGLSEDSSLLGLALRGTGAGGRGQARGFGFLLPLDVAALGGVRASRPRTSPPPPKGPNYKCCASGSAVEVVDGATCCLPNAEGKGFFCLVFLGPKRQNSKAPY